MRLLTALLLLSSCGLTKQQVSQQLQDLPKNAPIREHGLTRTSVTVESGDRTRTFETPWLDARGPAAASGAPILLIHGTPSSLFTWSRVVFGGEDANGPYSGLAEDFRVLAPDLPGHGASAPEAHPADFDLMVDFLVAFLDTVGVEQVVAVGHSYGGEVAWRLALDHPQRVQRLVLVDSSGYHRPEAEVPEEEWILKTHPLARWGRSLTSLEDVAESLVISFADGVPEQEAQENHILIQNGDNWQVMIDLAKEEEGLRQEEIATLRVPTLIVWGAQDGNFPPSLHAERFAADVAGSRQEWVDGAGHYVPVEAPRQFLESLRRFLAENPVP